MTFADFMKDLVATDLGRIVAANAVDGAATGLHSQNVAKAFFKKPDFKKLIKGPSPYKEFLRQGADAAKLAGWFGSDVYGTKYKFTGSFFVVVWSIEILFILASEKDRSRMIGPTNLLPAPGRGGEGLSAKLATLPEEERWFTLKKDVTFGKDYFWFAPASVLVGLLKCKAVDRATVCRDRLGLIHRKKGDVLVAMRVPGRILEEVKHARPTFVEGALHPRFSAKARSPGVRRDDSFGRTIDLNEVHETTSLQDGAQERVGKAFDSDVFEDGEHILFDILGQVSNTRGLSNDGDDAYSQKLAAGRNDDELLHALMGMTPFHRILRGGKMIKNCFMDLMGETP